MSTPARRRFRVGDRVESLRSPRLPPGFPEPEGTGKYGTVEKVLPYPTRRGVVLRVRWDTGSTNTHSASMLRQRPKQTCPPPEGR